MLIGVHFDNTRKGLRNFEVRKIFEEHPRHFLAPWHLEAIEAVASRYTFALLWKQSGIAVTKNKRNQLDSPSESERTDESERTLPLLAVLDPQQAATCTLQEARKWFEDRGRATRRKT